MSKAPNNREGKPVDGTNVASKSVGMVPKIRVRDAIPLVIFIASGISLIILILLEPWNKSNRNKQTPPLGTEIGTEIGTEVERN